MITEAQALDYLNNRRGVSNGRVIGEGTAEDGTPALKIEADQDCGTHVETLRGVVFLRSGRRSFEVER